MKLSWRGIVKGARQSKEMVFGQISRYLVEFQGMEDYTHTY